MGERRLQDAPQNVADESDVSWSTQPVGGRVGGDGEENQKLEEPSSLSRHHTIRHSRAKHIYALPLVNYLRKKLSRTQVS